MKVLYLVYLDLETTDFLGVKKKILWQLEGMKKLGLDVELAYKKNNDLVFINERGEKKEVYSLGKAWYRIAIYKGLKKALNNRDIDVVYIRTPGFIDLIFYLTLKMVKKKNKKVFLELPTYPIGKEFITHYKQLIRNKEFLKFSSKVPVGLIHKIYSRRMKKHVDNIVTFMPYKRIWGIEVIEIDNGVSVESVPLIKNVGNSEVFTIIAVANIDSWHGYDRVIRGMSEYYKEPSESNKPRVIFKLVGEGKELNNLIELAKKLNVFECVEFLGRKDGEALNSIFDSSHIAISSIGMHRIGLKYGSTLKTKEYCARGVPFIYGYNEKNISSEFKYALKVSAEDTALNINEIISFQKNVARDSCFSTKMREFALENFTWDKQMEKVKKNMLK
ncbi:glycosyltransferase [Planococcus maritimus]|uniref:Glycosyltransferase n=1 Tax=Planococcus maritimus TaxID=192421 RepID=A0A7D7RMK0_PLAMR|nr:glycosyltransferase [Planococcus maritimus]QMT16759.1 glycosyltransferase [Planococcus maritimus]